MTEERFSFLDLEVVFASQASKDLLERVRRLAAIDSSVLIDGESGSGKEILARAIHCSSKRSRGPFVDVSCAALPDQLVESELFGYERGAFSGADSRKEGLFELAEHGTLFLDEIGELPLQLQSKLLRVLECNTFYRLGGTKKIHSDVRIVAATNRVLRTEVREGRFRDDLYHRLAQLRVQTLPLRGRVGDILPISRFILGKLNCGSVIAPDAAETLLNYPWPGNVRELRNCLLQASAAADGNLIERNHLPEELRNSAAESVSTAVPSDGGLLYLLEATRGTGGPPLGRMEWMERKLIFDTLRENNGHQEKTASVLGISSRTLSRKLKVYESQPGNSATADKRLGA